MTFRRPRFVFLVFCIVLAVLAAALAAPHGNLLRKVVHDAWTSPADIGPSIAFSRYWTTHVRALRYSPDRGVSNFDWSRNGGADLDEFEKGRLAWHRGEFRTAVAHLEEHQRRRGESREGLFWLAMAYLRLAEAENCLAPLIGEPGSGHGLAFHRPDAHGSMCSLPLDVHHRQEGPSRTAALLFERLLDHYDPEDRLYRWLLNFCYMTVGGYPQEVPERYRLQGAFVDAFYGAPSLEFERRTSHLAFRDVAHELGVDTLNSGKGAAVEDFDRDGYLDIVTGGHYTQLVYLRNDAGRRFVDRSEEAGIDGFRGIHIITAADYDDDGWIDVLFSRPNDPGKGSFVLLRNRGDGTFVDVTASVGLLPAEAAARPRIMTWGQAWGDVDLDGDLDLFLANFSLANPLGDGPTMPSKLFLNQGGTFEDATQRFGLARFLRYQAVFGAAFGDFDDDGFPDLALTHWSPGDGVLLRNVKGLRFEPTELVVPEVGSFMTAFLDADHDGDLDLYLGGIAGIAESVTAQAVFGEGRGSSGGRTMLWLQRGDGRFDVDNGFFARQMPIGTMGSSFGDLDNDGAYDFYLGTGNPEGWYILPNLMYLGSTADGRPVAELTNISRLFGFGTVQKGHGIIFFDFDNDGDQDIFSSLGGMWPGDAWPNQFFLNESRLDAAWVKIRLRGTRANSHGVGARIKIVAHDRDGGEIVRYHHMNNKTGFGSAPYLAHVGLGAAVAIDRVEVRWPGEDRPRLYAAEPGRLHVLDQG